MDTFLPKLTKETEVLRKVMRRTVSIDITDSDNETFDSATVCYLCKLQLVDGDNVRKHCHLTRGAPTLGATHNASNLNYKMPLHISVFLTTCADTLSLSYSRVREVQRQECVLYSDHCQALRVADIERFVLCGLVAVPQHVSVNVSRQSVQERERFSHAVTTFR